MRKVSMALPVKNLVGRNSSISEVSEISEVYVYGLSIENTAAYQAFCGFTAGTH